MDSSAVKSAELDAVLLEFFQTYEDIIKCRADLDQVMKDGYFLMAKARYNMGPNSVTQLQFPEEMESLTQIEVFEGDGAVTFTPTSADSSVPVETISSTNSDSHKLRKRNVKQESDISESDISDDLNKLNIGEKESPNHVSAPKKNPLKWFGVLVSPSLKQSQSCFQKAVSLSCQLTSLQTKYVQLQKQYREMKNKYESEKETVVEK